MPGPWQRLIDAVYDPRHFLRSETGTLAVDEYPELLEKLVCNYVGLLDAKSSYKVKRIERINEQTELSTLLTRSSVMIVATEDHWRCLVDVDGADLFFACSAVWQDDPAAYQEQGSPRLARTFNDRRARKTFGFWDGPAFVVTQATTTHQ
jgi:hypothetical protein